MPFVRLREGLALKVKQIQAIKDADLRCLPVGQQLLAPCLSAAAAALTAKESIRQFLYRAGVFRQHSLPAPVISVGNLTPASGKTPIVMHIARHLFQFHGITSLIVQTGGGTVDETVMMENEFRWVLTSTLRPDERYSLATLTRTHSHSLALTRSLVRQRHADQSGGGYQFSERAQGTAHQQSRLAARVAR